MLMNEVLMRKRYAFWKTPAGKPYAGNDGKHAPTQLLGVMGKSATLNAEGNIQWNNFGVLRLEAAIKAAVVILDPVGDELNETDSWMIVRNAIQSGIREAGGGKPLAPSRVSSLADDHAAAYFRQDKSPYVFLTSLSIKSFPCKSLTLNGCAISPLRKRGSRYPMPEVANHQEPQYERHIRSSKYLLIRVSTSGRTIYEATEKALSTVNFLRGIWNFSATYGHWSITFSSNVSDPLGVIHGGPIHTLHRPDGKLVDDICWCDPDFNGDKPLFQPEDGWKTIESNRRAFMIRMRTLPYRKDLENIIIRYASALDKANLHIAFLHLWSLLEKMTDTIGANYDETVRRAAWGWSERELVIEILNSLRLRRNQYVHSASVAEDHDQATYLMKQFLEPHLLRLMNNELAVESLEEYGRYLSLPSDIPTLQKQKRRLDHALRTLKKWERQS